MGAGGMGGCDADLDTDPNNCGKCGRVCLHDAAVDTPRCVDGVCASFCESGFVNIEKPPTGPDDGCEDVGRRVFVTEDVMAAAAVEGVDSADTFCQTRAEALELGGAWAAWLSDEAVESSPSMRFNTDPPAPYRLVDFKVIADSWEVLISGDGVMLGFPIDLTESLIPASNPVEAVWTGTTAEGLPSGSHCASWTGEGKGAAATVGKLTQLTSEWTEVESLPLPCDQMARLYCFEQ